MSHRTKQEIYYPEDSLPLHISKKSASLMLLQRIRDEAHRFAITFHISKRSKSTFKTELEEIPGIGPGSIDLLLKKFKSFNKIKKAPTEFIEEVIGKSKSQLIYNYLQSKKGG